MRVIDQELVNDIDPTDDTALSRLGDGTEPYAVVYRDLDYSVLEYVDLDSLSISNFCLKFKIGLGWVIKVFPPDWNGHTKIIQLSPKLYESHSSIYAEPVRDFVPDAWDLKYTHSWKYEGTKIEAVSFKFLPNTYDVKESGYVKLIETENVFDVIFISYNELNAEENYQRLLEKCPTAKRISGVKGILNAHKAAADLATTEMFWVIDGDAYLVDDFKFTSVPYDRNKVHIWHSKNPINGLEYGYGGVKLFPKHAFSNLNESDIIDVSSSVGNGTIIVKQIACETRFNTDDFNTWKSAFRESAKLALNIVKGLPDISRASRERITVWCSQGDDPYALDGARQGALFSKQNSTDISKINDFEWLYEQFSNRQGLIQQRPDGQQDMAV